ncbi:MAG: hypothetical protein HY914_14255 [Desulfomonile tiedjei]|nr:hypothetical protein [Desulfomonile tiedjei]
MKRNVVEKSWRLLKASLVGRAAIAVRRRLRGDERNRRAFVRTLDAAFAKGHFPSGDNHRVAFVSMGAGLHFLRFEALLGHALRLRGARVDYILCDLPELPMCSRRIIIYPDNHVCRRCIGESRPVADGLRLRWRGLSRFLDPGVFTKARAVVAALRDDELDEFVFNGRPLGIWIRTTLCHFLLSDAQDTSGEVVDAKRRLLVSAIIHLEAAKRFLEVLQPTTLVALSGKHLEWRIAVELAKEAGISVYCYEVMGDPLGGYDLDYHFVTHNVSPDDAHLGNVGEVWAWWQSQPASEGELAALDDLLHARRRPRANLWVTDGGPQNPEEMRRRLSLTDLRPIAVAFPSVSWDLMNVGKDIAFTSQLDWIRCCVEYFAKHPDWQLIIRSHPGEVRIPGMESRKKVAEVVGSLYPVLPHNIRVIPPEDPVSSYVLIELSTLVLVYTSTLGMEAVAVGRPTVLCGNPQYRGRRFTYDVSSPDEFCAVVGRLMREPVALNEEMRLLAKKSLYLWRNLAVPFGWTDKAGKEFRVTSVDQLKPGANEILDEVCRAMLAHEDVPLLGGMGFWNSARD